jgi:hypothetical protein
MVKNGIPSRTPDIHNAGNKKCADITPGLRTANHDNFLLIAQNLIKEICLKLLAVKAESCHQPNDSDPGIFGMLGSEANKNNKSRTRRQSWMMYY